MTYGDDSLSYTEIIATIEEMEEEYYTTEEILFQAGIEIWEE